MNVIEIVKAHPVPVGLGVLVLVLLLSSRGSSSVSSNSAASAASFQAQTQIAGVNAQAAVALGGQATERYKTSMEAANGRASLAASLLSSFAGIQAQSAMNDSNNAQKTVMGAFAADINRQTIDAQYKTNLATINSNVVMNADKINGSIKALEMDGNFKLAQIGAATQGQIALIGANKDSALALGAQSAAYLPTMMAHEENMAKINGANQIAQINANGPWAVALAKENNYPAVVAAKAGKTANEVNAWGNAIGNVLGSGGGNILSSVGSMFGF